MADKEKLIELVGQVQDCGCDVTDVVEMNYVENSVLVDHLISEGVTVRERGRWIPHYETFDADTAVGILGGTYQTGWQCSVCGRYEPGKEPYCNCGADMRPKGEGEEDA